MGKIPLRVFSPALVDRALLKPQWQKHLMVKKPEYLGKSFWNSIYRGSYTALNRIVIPVKEARPSPNCISPLRE